MGEYFTLTIYAAICLIFKVSSFPYNNLLYSNPSTLE